VAPSWEEQARNTSRIAAICSSLNRLFRTTPVRGLAGHPTGGQTSPESSRIQTETKLKIEVAADSNLPEKNQKQSAKVVTAAGASNADANIMDCS
jgi:hypothetical protein